MSSDDRLRRLDSLLRVSLRLARSAPSGRVALARVYNMLEPDWIPRPEGDALLAELKAAHAQATEPLALGEVKRVLRDAWDADPDDELEELEPEPAAVTPIAQVHRGVLDGSAVAIKVLRPGIAASVRQDLALLESLLSPLRSALPSIDAAAVLREVREQTLDELDLDHEASVQRHFHRRLRNHPMLTVPAPVMRFSHEDVLVSEWVEGVSLWDAPDPDGAAARLAIFTLGAGRAGYLYADAHPADVLMRPDGKLAIVDFGATRAVDPQRLDVFSALLEAFIGRDVEGQGLLLEQLGWLPASHAERAQALAIEVLGELAGPDSVRLDTQALIGVRDRLFARPRAAVELLLAGSLPPEDLWTVRAVTALFGTIARVGATGRWRELARDALRDGWEAEPS